MRLSWLTCRRGTAAVEFAVIAPVLLVLFGGIIEFGLAVYDSDALAGAARAAAQYAWFQPNDDAGIKAAAANASGLPSDSITVSTPARFCECPDGTASNCTSACPGGSVRRFVSVTVERNFSRVTGITSFAVPSSLTAQAVVRTQ